MSYSSGDFVLFLTIYLGTSVLVVCQSPVQINCSSIKASHFLTTAGLSCCSLSLQGAVCKYFEKCVAMWLLIFLCKNKIVILGIQVGSFDGSAFEVMCSHCKHTAFGSCTEF